MYMESNLVLWMFCNNFLRSESHLTNVHLLQVDNKVHLVVVVDWMVVVVVDADILVELEVVGGGKFYCEGEFDQC